MPRNHQVPIHQVPSNMYNMYEEFEVEDCLNRRSLIREFQRNGRDATVDQAGPANDNGEVELDGEVLLYCEALLASEASPLGIGDSAGEPEQLSDGQDSNLEQPAILLPAILLPAVVPPAVEPPAVETPAIMPPSVVPPMASKQVEQAMALLGQGFRLLGPVLSHLVASEKAGLPGPSSPIVCPSSPLPGPSSPPLCPSSPLPGPSSPPVCPSSPLPGPSSPRPGSSTPRPDHHSGSPKAGPASPIAGPSKGKKIRSEEKKLKYKKCIKCKTKGHISKFCPKKVKHTTGPVDPAHVHAHVPPPFLNFPPPVLFPPSFPPPPVILPPSFPPPPHYDPRPPFPVPHPTFHYPNFNANNFHPPF
ncbi:vegetative cell wall protein gp1-like [Daphnia magna]|uniref:vegetative cell wall protein gp1-like n=1 Tax=Daphnia magna TaxID=35525 RepID=UPI001E1BD3F6|nr:vegetative cell wall protein gp1-like [Daphnia magna]